MKEKPDQPTPTNGETAAEISILRERAELNRLTNIISVCLLPAAICVALGVFAFIKGYRELKSGGADLTAWGNFGSYLQGTTGSVWALAGVFIIFVAFLMQLRQLGEQREQFRLQSESIKRQNFESSFFQLLNLQNQITAGLRCTDSFGQPIVDRACFQCWQSYLRQEYGNRKIILSEEEPDHVKEAYKIFYNGAQAALAHYFRNLYHTIKFVKSSDISDKRRYTSLVRAQLSAYELTLLFYSCLSVFGEGFKPLIEEFGLLEHLDDGLLMDPAHKQFYAASAYQ